MPTFDQSINTRLTTDGDILTRTAGAPARLTRAALAADAAFAGKYVAMVAAPTGVAATDTAAILAANTALAATGGEILLQAGGYATDATIPLNTGVAIKGKGYNTTDITCSAAVPVITIGASKNFCKVIGLRLSAAAGRACISVASCSLTVIRECYFLAGLNGVLVDASYYVAIDDCYGSTALTGDTIKFQNVSNANNVRGGRIQGTNGFGINVESGTVNIEGVTLEHTNPIRFNGASGGWGGCWLEGTGVGVTITTSATPQPKDRGGNVYSSFATNISRPATTVGSSNANVTAAMGGTHSTDDGGLIDIANTVGSAQNLDCTVTFGKVFPVAPAAVLLTGVRINGSVVPAPFLKASPTTTAFVFTLASDLGNFQAIQVMYRVERAPTS